MGVRANSTTAIIVASLLFLLECRSNHAQPTTDAPASNAQTQGGTTVDAAQPRTDLLPELSPSAPKDQPVASDGLEEVREMAAAMAPYTEQARRTYPDAKRRYLSGLPPGHTFFVTARLSVGQTATEQVFIAVSGIDAGRISGRIASDVLDVAVAAKYKAGDEYSLQESDIVDWLMTRPDGTEEGNVVGKFLDEWQKSHGKALR